METPQGPSTPPTPPPASPPPEPTPLTQEQAMAKVKPPAIALIVAAGIGMAYGLLMILLNALGMTAGTVAGANDPANVAATVVSGGAGIVMSMVGIAFGLVIIFGAIKMMQLQLWPLAIVASILAMIPCVSPCCLLGLPFGIWAIIVLANPQVKAAFN
ncbi:hypothetical protein ACERK3_13485 [Phycisphaerales bacterium AB-hyl4]|uniref:DUF4064 domain-containing protein n=1 Tax=Natronomicrosphaera hydrolytica TaxID=3242702 RepID=A0ABV4U8J0_9BACT